MPSETTRSPLSAIPDSISFHPDYLLTGKLSSWVLDTLNLGGLANLFPEDAEPEYVDINRANIAVVSLQENNHLVLVHVPTGRIIHHFNKGSVDLDQIDVSKDPEALIELSGALADVARAGWRPNNIFLVPDLTATGGAVLEKIEGMTVLANGKTLVVTDNDGVSDSNGETQLLRLDGLFK